MPLMRGTRQSLLRARSLPPIPFGAFDRDSGSIGAGGGNGWNANGINRFKTITGFYPAIAMWYQHWGIGGAPGSDYTSQWDFSSGYNACSTYWGLGIMPQITWMPDVAANCAAITSGTYDTYITTWANACKTYGGPVQIRFAHEMNGYWYNWGCDATGNTYTNTGAQYIAMWQHVRGIFTSLGVTNARWIWSPNISFSGTASLVSCYPGDAYVDYVALDGYNTGSNTGSTWQTFSQLFLPDYTLLRAFTQKPFMLGEFGCVEVGGNKAAWLQDAFMTQAPALGIQAMVYFDVLDSLTDPTNDNWLLDSTTAVATKAAAIAANPLYRGAWQGWSFK